MDMVWITAFLLLWGLLALMVWGFKKLEKNDGGRP